MKIKLFFCAECVLLRRRRKLLYQHPLSVYHISQATDYKLYFLATYPLLIYTISNRDTVETHIMYRLFYTLIHLYKIMYTFSRIRIMWLRKVEEKICWFTFGCNVTLMRRMCVPLTLSRSYIRFNLWCLNIFRCRKVYAEYKSQETHRYNI